MDRRAMCCIDRCLTKTKSIKVKDIIYYLFPTDADWANKWEKKIKEFDPTYKRKANDIVCSLHFAKTSMQPVTRQLVDHALPIYFPQKLADAQIVKIAAPASINKKIVTPPSNQMLGTKCCIDNCTTDFVNTEPKIHGFEFPYAPEQRKMWKFIIELYNNQELNWRESMRICALHFPRELFIKDDELMEGAKPSIFSVHAIQARKKEINQQQAKSLNQGSPVKAMSINVPLHKKNADIHSMSRRSVPESQCQMSMSYSKLPQLIPKPNMKRAHASPSPCSSPSPNPTSNETVMNKIQRLSTPNGQVTATVKPGPIALRPVPALNKVYTVVQDGQSTQFTPKQFTNTTVLRKSMPPPLVNKTQVTRASIIENGVEKVIAIAKPITTHITRLPPALKPAPKPQIAAKKFVNIPKEEGSMKMPVITKVHSIKSAPNIIVRSQNARKSTTPRVKSQNTAIASTSSQIIKDKKPLDQDVIVINDDEVEMAMAIKSTEEDISSSTVPTAMVKIDGADIRPYFVQNASVFEYPLKLLDRIQLKKKQNDELSTQLQKWKKMAFKLNQQFRLQKATTVTETIEIS